MGARNTSSAGAKPGTKRRKTGITKTSPEDQALRGVKAQTIREGTPLQVQQVLDSLEASGEIGPDEDIVQDEIPSDDIIPEMDADVDLSDEDKPLTEELEDDDANLLDGDSGDEPSGTPFASRRYEIVVIDGCCSVPIDGRWIRNPRSPAGPGANAIYELSSRIWTLSRIATWLTERRGDFLRQRDLWYLGCEALEDIKQGRIPVQQKSFLDCAGLHPRVSREQLSRFIRAADIAWTDGNAPLDILFSTEAHRAWVAHAIKQFVEKGRERVTVKMLAKYKSVKVKRSDSADLAKKTSDAMDLPTFIQKVNMLAGTQWAEVVEQYGDRMTR